MALTPIELLDAIADMKAEDIDEVVTALHCGFMDEWDCGLKQALDTFGGFETKIAAGTGAHYARSWKEARDRGEV